MHHTQYEETLLDIYALCENYIALEGIHEEKFITYLENNNIKMDLLDFYYNILVQFIKKSKDDINDIELKKTYISGSIIPPPEDENIFITQEYLNDVRDYAEYLRGNQDSDSKTKIFLSFNLESSSLIAFHYQLKWAIEIIKKIRSKNLFFTFLMSGLNDED